MFFTAGIPAKPNKRLRPACKDRSERGQGGSSSERSAPSSIYPIRPRFLKKSRNQIFSAEHFFKEALPLKKRELSCLLELGAN